MYMRNTLESKKETWVMVHGNKYFVARNGYISDPETGKAINIEKADFEKLRQNTQAWDAIKNPPKEGAQPAPQPEVSTQPEEQGRPKLRLLDETGSPIEIPAVPKEETPEDAPTLITADEIPEAAIAPEEGAKEVEAEPQGDPPIPKGDDEWTHPDLAFSMEWLKKCADAYDVKYRKNTTKQTLVDKIVEEMYE